MSTVLDKYVLSEGFDEQVRNAIIGADSENFDDEHVNIHSYALCEVRTWGAMQVLKHLYPQTFYRTHEVHDR